MLASARWWRRGGDRRDGERFQHPRVYSGFSRRRVPCARTDRTRTAGGRPMRGRGATRGLHAEHYRRADQPASLFLVAAGARTAEALHDGGEKVLKAFREFRIEGEPALHQRFRRKLIDVGHHLLLKLVHHRDLHRRDIREPDELAGLEGCAIYLDVYFHVPSWPDFDIGPSAAESTFTSAAQLILIANVK